MQGESERVTRKKLRQKDFEKKYESFFSECSNNASSICSKVSKIEGGEEICLNTPQRSELESEKELLFGQNLIFGPSSQKAIRRSKQGQIPVECYVFETECSNTYQSNQQLSITGNLLKKTRETSYNDRANQCDENYVTPWVHP